MLKSVHISDARRRPGAVRWHIEHTAILAPLMGCVLSNNQQGMPVEGAPQRPQIHLQIIYEDWQPPEAFSNMPALVPSRPAHSDAPPRPTPPCPHPLQDSSCPSRSLSWRRAG